MIAHKFKVILGIVLAVFIAMAMPSFASPELSDADISFSVKGYYTYYRVVPNYTPNSYITSGGSVDQTDSYSNLSPYIDVVGYKTIFLIAYTGSAQPFGTYAFYDSNYVFIPGSYGSRNNFISVPSNATYFRFSQYVGGSAGYVLSLEELTSLPQYIYNSIETTSISADGDITIPYQVNSYDAVMLDFKFFDSTYTFNNISFRQFITYTGGYFSGVREWADDRGVQFYQYYYDNSGDYHEFYIGNSSSNPYIWNLFLTSSVFSGFKLIIPFSSVSTSLNLNLTDFKLDGEDVSARLEVDRVLDQLDDLAEQLVLPSPDLDTLLDVGTVLNNTNDTNASGIMSVIASDGGIITTMMVISVSITVLGYILFGKKEA